MATGKNGRNGGIKCVEWGKVGLGTQRQMKGEMKGMRRGRRKGEIGRKVGGEEAGKKREERGT